MPEDGPVAQADGGTIWYRNGVVHRDDGPAIERADGTREWFADGVRHNETGPAFIGADGERRWFFHGKEFTEAEFEGMRRRTIKEGCVLASRIISAPFIRRRHVPLNGAFKPSIRHSVIRV